MLDDAHPHPTTPQRPLHEQTIARLNNQQALSELGFDTHPYTYPQTHHKP